MESAGFAFKRFYVRHDRCAMKVGTDGVLLGAWAPISNGRILDIGTGCGLVALMLAQRCPDTHIDAIDINASAVEQAQDNFEQSPFRTRLSAFTVPLQNWQGGPYDLIVSNPPYFQNSLKNPDKAREQARHTDTLSYEELIAYSARLLKPNGQLALILPAEAEEAVQTLATDDGLSLTHVTHVYSKESKPIRRVLLSFEITRSRDHATTPVEDTLVLEDETGGRSTAYQELTKDFYL